MTDVHDAKRLLHISSSVIFHIFTF
jgi:hypothetical protein